jgi:predicted DsbA family dithiol-disulfide isomerase
MVAGRRFAQRYRSRDMPVTLDVWSDIVCPWCYIGRRRLAAALAEEGPGSVDVRWRAFQLQPDIPPEGLDAAEYFAAKFGGPERLRQIHDRVAGEAAKVGLTLRFDLQRRAPNTLLAHRAIALAPDAGAALDALFAAHFEQGLDIGDRDTVLRVVDGLDAEALDRGDGTDAVHADLQAAREIGVTGVPFFVAGGRVALSGAHEPALLRRLLEAAREQAAA